MLTLIPIVRTIAILHLMIAMTHGMAHHMIPVPISMFQMIFVTGVIVIAPIVGVLLLQSGDRWVGSFVFLCTMIGALLFNHFHHFVQISADHVSQIPTTAWGQVFQLTARWLEVVEIGGCIAAIGLLRQVFYPNKPSLK